MESKARHWRDTLIVALIIAASIGISYWLRRDIPVNHDVNWFVVAAERIMQGGSFSLDVFEVNMPLATAIYVPSLLAASAFSVGLPAGILLWTYACFVASVCLTWRALPAAPSGPVLGTLAWLACFMAVFPGYEFAEREHLATMLTLPFVALVGNSRLDHRRGFRIFVSALAAVGCFLKPHYALLPFLLLLIRVPYVGLRHVVLSAECVTLVCVGVANAALVVLCFPEWLDSARWTVDLYHHYRGDSPARFLSADSALVSLVAMTLLAFTVVFQRNLLRVAAPFLISAAYAWIAFVLQGKGWRYHVLPTGLFAAAGLAIAWAHLRPPALREGRQLLLWTMIAAVGIGLFAHAVDINRRAPKLSNLRQSAVGHALSISRPGDAVYVFSTSAVPYFPAMIHLDLEWASRYSALWPLSALGKPDALLDAEGIALKRRYTPAFIAQVTDDLRRRKPDIALVDLRAGQFGLPGHFDFLGFFLRSPDFAAEWANYQKIGQSRDMAIYVRSASE